MRRLARIRFATVTAVCLGMLTAATASAADDPRDQLLPNYDVRTDADPVAARQSQRLERSLGPQGFVESSEQTGAVAFVGRTDALLTARSGDEPADVVLDYVRENRAAFGLDLDDVDDLVLDDSYRSVDGVTHVSFSQKSDGIDSFDSHVVGHVTKGGRLINVSGAPVSDLSVPSTDPELTAAQALRVARDNVGGSTRVPPVEKRSQGPRRKTTYQTYAESAQLTIFATAGQDRLAWEVQVQDTNSILYRVVVDALSGDVLLRQSLTAFDNNDAQVWPLHPSKVQSRIPVNFGTDPTWLDRSAANGNQLIGNNTHTYVDNNGTDGYQSGEQVTRNGGLGGNWTYPMSWFTQAECPDSGCTWDSTNNATKTTNRNPGAVGLFYLTNRFHDHLAKPPIGFDEASRNFEHVNSTGLGVGGDAVRAEAQDSSGLSNANFTTPADGTPGRMQMYLFSGPGVGGKGPQYDVDGSASADVVYHEYGHGLSNRLVGNGGGLSAMQSGAMGEGWSDFYALDLLVAEGSRSDPDGPGDVWMGEYVTGVPGIFGGITRIRYQAIDCPVGAPGFQCPASGTAGPGGYTYGDLGKIGASSTSVHNNGEIWSQTMWDLRTALGRDDALRIITGGMRLSPLSPSMLMMRNAILQSAVVAGVDTSKVWAVFAARGMGEDATTPSANSTVAVEDFSMPPTSVTEAAGDITVDAATLNGLHRSGGKPTDYRFEFGQTAGYGQVSETMAGGSALAPVAVSSPITGLAPNTEYHYRLVGLRGGLVVSQGQDRTFTTDSPPPPPPVPAADTVAPVVKITKAPKKKMKTKKAKARVKVRFASEPGARFTCKIDSKKYKACTSPAKFKVKAAKGKRAKHRVLVVATDAAGNASVPALVRFRVIRK